jgi:hypothetical protein
MFDPTIGRWTTQDPIGFQAGDDNLYRYVDNHPTNATDPSGLEGHPPTKFGIRMTRKDFTANLAEHDKVQLGQDGATITASVDEWWTDSAKTRADPFVRISVKLNGNTDFDKAILKRSFWLQTLKVDRYKDVGMQDRDNSDSFGQQLWKDNTGKEKIDVTVRFGETALDGGVATVPWMTDNDKNPYERTDTSLSFWDDPSAKDVLSTKHPMVVQNYEAYLIVEGRAMYVVNWVVFNEKGKERQVKISGGRIPTTLPPFLDDPSKKLFRGRAPLFMRDPDIENPVKGVKP